MGKKSTQAVVKTRVQEVSEKMLDGYSRADIIRYASNQNWELSDRQVETYMQKANLLIESEVDERREQVVKKHIRRREKLYKMALESKNFKVANGILDSMAKIDGSLIERKEVNLNGSLGLGAVSDEELEKMIQKELSQGKDGSTQG